MNIFTSKDVKHFFNNVVERVYDAGQIVVYLGDKPNHAMFIKSGAVKLHDTDKNGNEKIMHIAGAGSFFPLFYIYEDKSIVHAFYSTVVKSEILMVPLKDFRAKLRTNPGFASKLLKWYASEMDHIVMRLKSLEKSNSRQKVLRALYYLCDQHSTHFAMVRPGWCRIGLPVTQQLIADLTGLTRETVNVAMKEIEEQKLVRTPKQQIMEVHRARIAKKLKD